MVYSSVLGLRRTSLRSGLPVPRMFLSVEIHRMPVRSLTIEPMPAPSWTTSIDMVLMTLSVVGSIIRRPDCWWAAKTRPSADTMVPHCPL